MSLKERIYSVLVVSASDKFTASLLPLLPESTYYPVKTVSDIASAQRDQAERFYDLIIINSPLTDDNGVRFAIDCSAAQNTIVLVLVRSEIQEEIRQRLTAYGVFTLPKPLSKSMLTAALHWMTTTRERLRTQETKTLSFEEKMAEIRLVNRAKWLLISELKMEEPQAHRYIEKQAMDRCISKREVAEQLIRMYAN